ncbi:MAG: ROK family protein [Chloroflexi bacterium]|nr:ROK family protein [Chloroflexota bacterium]
MVTRHKAYIGIDLGGTSLLVAVVGPEGEILGEVKRKTKPELGAASVIERMVQAVHKAIARSGLKYRAIGGVGVGVPGPVQPKEGLVVHCPNLGPSWNHLALEKRLSKHLQLPVTIDNDVNVGAVGEHTYGAGRGSEHMLAIFVGTGIGGGLIVDGKLYTGARYSAGEVGHMPLMAGGPVCSCGRQGHAEALASRSAMEREIRAALDGGRSSIVPDLMARQKRSDMSSAILGDAYDARDSVTVEVVEKAQYYLGLLVAACVNLLDPQIVVIGGGVLERMGDAYLEPVRNVAIEHYINSEQADQVRVVRASLGDYSGALGAAVLARQRLA